MACAHRPSTRNRGENKRATAPIPRTHTGPGGRTTHLRHESNRHKCERHEDGGHEEANELGAREAAGVLAQAVLWQAGLRHRAAHNPQPQHGEAEGGDGRTQSPDVNTDRLHTGLKRVVVAGASQQRVPRFGAGELEAHWCKG